MFLGGDDQDMAQIARMMWGEQDDGHTMEDYKAELQVVYDFFDKCHTAALEFVKKIHDLPNPTPHAKKMAEEEHSLFCIQKRMAKLLLDLMEETEEEAS